MNFHIRSYSMYGISQWPYNVKSSLIGWDHTQHDPCILIENLPSNTRHTTFNSLIPGRCGFKRKLVIFKLISRINILSTSCKIALRWMPQHLTNDAIWRHRSGSTMAQVMACWLMVPSHYLNQYWIIISEVLRHSIEGKLKSQEMLKVSSIIYPWHEFENFKAKITTIYLPGVNELNSPF